MPIGFENASMKYFKHWKEENKTEIENKEF